MKFNITDSEFTGLFAFLAAWGQAIGVWAVGVAILTVLVQVVFAIAVYRDATELDRTRNLIIAGPAIWGIATLISGVITAAIYWAMHHSRLNPDIPIAATETTETEEA
jgi:hypothetical protein